MLGAKVFVVVLQLQINRVPKSILEVPATRRGEIVTTPFESHADNKVLNKSNYVGRKLN